MEDNIENIIIAKSYFELDHKERELIKEWASCEDEYNQLKSVFLATDLFKEQQEEELNPTIKQRLDVRFKEKYDRERLVWYNKLWLFLWPENTGVVRKPLLQLAAVGMVVLIVTPFLFQSSPSDQRLAMNEKIPQEEKGEVEQESKNDKGVEIDGDESSTTKEPKISSKESLDDLERTPVMSSPTESKNLESKLEEIPMMEDELRKSGWELSDEVAESESSDKTVPSLDLTTSDQMPKQDKDMFAGAVMKSDDSFDSEDLARDSESESRAADYRASKKVDPEKTIDLLTALY